MSLYEQYPPIERRYVSRANQIRNVLARFRFKRVAFVVPRDTMYDRDSYNTRLTVRFTTDGRHVSVFRFDDKYAVEKTLEWPDEQALIGALEYVYQLS